MTINYLLGNLGRQYSDTVGVVDLGGGSVQMAYAISEADSGKAPKPIDGEDTYVKQMKLKGKTYYLYVHRSSFPHFLNPIYVFFLPSLRSSIFPITCPSYLHYGLLAARAELLKVTPDSANPCILAGYDGTRSSLISRCLYKQTN